MHYAKANEISIPRFSFGSGEGEAFALSSHARAREALDAGLAIREPGFNIFVVGEDRAGRLSATTDYLHQVCRTARAKRYDWIYLYNFKDERAPLAFGLSPGDGRKFLDELRRFVTRLQTMLSAALESESHRERVLGIFRAVDDKLKRRQEEIRAVARASGFELEHTSAGLRLRKIEGAPGIAEDEQKNLLTRLDKLEHKAGRLRMEAEDEAQKLDCQTLMALLDFHKETLAGKFQGYPELIRWIDLMTEDMMTHLHLLYRRNQKDRPQAMPVRYQANLLVDRAEPADDCVIIEPNPTYDNLFGRIEYTRVDGIIETNHTLIRPGALHAANGGVLVLRADALSKNDTAWTFLKAALRDSELRIEELHRTGSVPITGTPHPQPIPLDVKIVLIGSPDHYYRYFSNDPDFKSYFKIKADIDPDMPASQSNLSNMAQLICRMMGERGFTCAEGAVSFLLGIAARYAGRRDMLTAQFELIEDLVSEACLTCGENLLTEEAVCRAWLDKKRRDSRPEERFFDSVERGHVAVQTQGSVVGQINGLTVRDIGDYQFGRPSRLTARAWVGERGVINIERVTDLGGRIQQKGAMIVEGYLRGMFGQYFPISFDSSITFEQNYGGIDGDSASIAELVAIISALADVPIRQDFAVTGSFNQLGEVQAVGDVTEKVEGFFNATRFDRLDGYRAGVLLPLSNIKDLVLEDEVIKAIERRLFSVIGIDRVEQAIEFFIGAGQLTWRDIYAKVRVKLAQFDEILTKRKGREARPLEV